MALRMSLFKGFSGLYCLVVVKIFLIFFGTLLMVKAIEIRIDYTYDTNNFFDTQQKRDALEAVAEFYGSIIQDKLLRIDESDFGSVDWSAVLTHPGTGNSQSVPGLVVPADVVIVYVGGRELGGSTLARAGPGGFSASGTSAWFQRIRGRGQPGAETSTPSLKTDFATWGGSMTFDMRRIWNFSQTENGTGSEFITVALHEMGHILGIGTADHWDNQLADGAFTGTAVVNSHGSAPLADSGHFHESINSKLFGCFGASHGTPRPALMLPFISDNGSNFDVVTDLDLAALVDIGWEVRPPTPLRYTELSPLRASFNWNSVSFQTYQVQRSPDLGSFASGGSAVGNGNGAIQFWSDPSPPVGKAFYRLAVNDVSFPAPLIAAPGAIADDEYRHIYQAPRNVADCCIHADE